MPIPTILAAVLPALAPALAQRVVEAFTQDPAGGETARRVAEAAVDALGTDDPAAATAALTESARLAEFRQAMLEVEIALLRLDNEDRAGARRREIETKDPTPSRLAYLILGGFLAYAFTILASAILGLAGIRDPLVAGLIGTGFGALGSEAARIGNYYFGSSAGSASKQKALVALKGT